ncbi:MAG: YggS family pyridoxal phosphate-dependent enzyme [Dehalogenimonas sp.]
MYDHIRRNVRRLLAEIPPGVTIVAAAKTRNVGEILAAMETGVSIIGENYVQEAAKAKTWLDTNNSVPFDAVFHFIGHLQPNKIKRAVELFDLIETVDSISLAKELDEQARRMNTVMPVLIEVNIASEPQKYGVLPDKLLDLALHLDSLPNLKLQGLMTMGPRLDESGLRPYFMETKRLLENLKTAKLPNADLRYLSMGMSNSYRTAIEEGANLIRLGTAIFGERS